jgi:glycerol-3-phosphate acyltransferase PlsY
MVRRPGIIAADGTRGPRTAQETTILPGVLTEPWAGLLLVALGYLSGALPMGVVVARATRARDPPTVGSGRTGGTNALRAMGARRAVAVAALDVLKGFVPVAAASLLGASQLVVALTGIAAVVGAWASVFLRFHGGRGVATAIGGALFVQPLAVLLAAPFFFGTIWVTRYVSVGSLLGTAAGAAWIGVFVVLGWNDRAHFLFGVAGSALVWVAHHDNVARLLRGEERRFEPFSRSDG